MRAEEKRRSTMRTGSSGAAHGVHIGPQRLEVGYRYFPVFAGRSAYFSEKRTPASGERSRPFYFEAGVPSDHLGTTTMKTVTRSCASLTEISGEAGRLAPQVFSASPETNNIR
jgi:hypothetical protein